jgi:hypothetical protein
VSRLPARREAQQLHRLRSLRVERARERCAAAQAALDAAHAAVRQRQHAIERCQHEIEALNDAVVHALAPQLPRWSTLIAARREKLADQLERAEYALVEDEHALEQAQEALQQARSEVSRALAREDAVRGLVDQCRRAHAATRERRAESELEDQPLPRVAS